MLNATRLFWFPNVAYIHVRIQATAIQSSAFCDALLAMIIPTKQQAITPPWTASTPRLSLLQLIKPSRCLNISQGRSLPIPDQSLIQILTHPITTFIQRPNKKLHIPTTRLCSLKEPLQRYSVALRRTLSTIIQTPDTTHCRRIALVCCLSVVLHGADKILGDAMTIVMEPSDIVLRIHIPLLG